MSKVHQSTIHHNKQHTHFISSVPEPAVHVIQEEAPNTLSNHFKLAYAIELDSSVVDTPIKIVANWSGNPSVSDSPRVSIAPPTMAPYTTSITFASLISTDFGDYQITVVVIPTYYGDYVLGSAEVLYRFSLSLSESHSSVLHHFS